jgi:uncharacterized protein
VKKSIALLTAMGSIALPLSATLPVGDAVAQIPMLKNAPVISPAVTELFKFIELQRTSEIRGALLKGVKADSTDARGDHALLVVAREGFVDGAKTLLDAGAKINLRNKFGDSALMVAALSGHEPMVKFLRSKGADINNSGWTALHYAAIGGHDNVVKYLLGQGADPSATSVNGVTALMMAARENKTGAVSMLLEYGADTTQKNDKGETAYDWAVREEHRPIMDILKKAK